MLLNECSHLNQRLWRITHRSHHSWLKSEEPWGDQRNVLSHFSWKFWISLLLPFSLMSIEHKRTFVQIRCFFKSIQQILNLLPSSWIQTQWAGFQWNLIVKLTEVGSRMISKKEPKAPQRSYLTASYLSIISVKQNPDAIYTHWPLY